MVDIEPIRRSEAIYERTSKSYHLAMESIKSNPTPFPQRRELEQLDATALAEHQLRKLNSLFGKILPANRFYEAKLGSFELPLKQLEQLQDLPFTLR